MKVVIDGKEEILKEDLSRRYWFNFALDQAMDAGIKFGILSRETALFFIGILLFFCGFLLNIIANIIYEVIKESTTWKWAVIFLTLSSLAALFWLTHKYIIAPLRTQKAEFGKLRGKAHEALDEWMKTWDAGKRGQKTGNRGQPPFIES